MNSSGTPSFRPLTPRKRRRVIGPWLLMILAMIATVAGLTLIISSLMAPGRPLNTLFATDTPTPTATLTFTPTATATATATETLTPTVTSTATPSAPFQYTVQEGDNLILIAQKFELAEDGIALILELNPIIAQNRGIIFPGQVIWIPNPDMRLPTATPIPPTIRRGTKITYTVLPGDTLAGIAAKFNSTVEAILAENKIENPNLLQAYQQLVIPVNLLTPTATRPPTSTPITFTPTFPAPLSPGTPTATPSSGSGTASCAFTTDPVRVQQVISAINAYRAQNNLPAYTVNSLLTRAAERHAADMACNQLFGHTGSDGSNPTSRVADSGYRARQVSENVYGSWPPLTPQMVVDWWKTDTSDPRHNQNLLSTTYTEIGVAYAFFNNFGYYVVVFAAP